MATTHLRGKHVLDRIRQRNFLATDTPLGVVGSFGKSVTVQESEQDRFLTVIATTDDIDVDGEVVIPGGADTSYFFKNRKIFVDHQLGTEFCVGTLHSANLKPNGWQCRIRMFKLPGNPLPDDILTIAREAGIGVSIGFLPTAKGAPSPEEKSIYKSASSIIRQWKWIELSIAAAPANISCQSTLSLSKSIEGKLALLDELVTKGRIAPFSAKALGLSVPRTLEASTGVPKRRTIVVID